MLLTYRLPDFLDYLADHYQNLYQLYVGRLTELFPSSQSTDNLIIAEDDRTLRKNRTTMCCSCGADLLVN